MDQLDKRTESQEQLASSEQRSWVTPKFERVPLKEALGGGSSFDFDDGFTYLS